MNTKYRILGSAGALAFIPALALAQLQLPADHVDFGIGFEAGALELHWHVEEPEPGIEYTPDEAYAFIPLSSTLLRPSGAQWDFTGAPDGGTLYLAPASAAAEVIFLGIGSHEISPATFVDNQVTLQLKAFTGPQGASFARWQTDPFGAPTAALGTASGPASFNLTTGGHGHYNWGFTAPGFYELTFTVSGTLTGETQPITDTGTFRFGVGTTPIPEPSAFAGLTGLGALFLTALRRRSQRH